MTLENGRRMNHDITCGHFSPPWRCIYDTPVRRILMTLTVIHDIVAKRALGFGSASPQPKCSLEQTATSSGRFTAIHDTVKVHALVFGSGA